ncbi:hypothetical protein BCR34DRAFT_43475 [Clohesyomyces aquaticus]|uniref:Lysozyme-like domain-containing protein n=1 Tax=Clohesyomyces aquaticus TaxID=1231657 RepID=A0A1Y1Z603_9PLEO|nr:hypothetical protein BCR34DRAFT_43475 [Clohesyomyces aquaticus]
MLFKSTVLIAGTIALASAAPVARASITAATIEAITPATASCVGAPFPQECRDATQAAGPIASSFQKYGISTAGEQAALLALMLYETDGFKYNKNHTPGIPGQGTRNMQSPALNLKYASSLFDAATVQQASAAGPDAVYTLLAGDNESFGSAAWFLNTQCSPGIRQGLASGTAVGWSAFLSQCVYTPDSEGRNAVWSAAIKAVQGS